MPKPKTLWQRIAGLFERLVWAVQGLFLRRKLKAPDSPLRSAAEEAVARVVYETELAPDCVSAGEIRGGCGIKVTHNDAQEWFVHNSYDEAATQAIEWANLQGDEIDTGSASKMPRKQRRAFQAMRRQDRNRQKAARRRQR